jgi:predicted DNA-binding protein (UPF0251 family)
LFCVTPRVVLEPNASDLHTPCSLACMDPVSQTRLCAAQIDVARAEAELVRVRDQRDRLMRLYASRGASATELAEALDGSLSRQAVSNVLAKGRGKLPPAAQ